MKCLSRMKGNFHVRFLEGKAVVIPPTHSIKSFDVYGYPVDGSSPVCTNRKVSLGAIVVLRQGKENRVDRLKASKAFKYLMEQTVADIWNAEELGILRKLWLELLELYPVYLLTCRPDHEAVRCLEMQLKKDGVISIGDD